MQLRLRASLSYLTLALVPWLSACPSSTDGDGEEEVGETAGTDETAETAATSDESGNDQGSSETANDTAMETGMETGTEETDTGTDETETTGDPSLNEQLCMDGCAVFAECLGGGGLPDCYDLCLEHHNSLDGACLGYEQALTACIIGLTCDELDQFIDEAPEPYPCQAEQELVCEEPICEASAGVGVDPGECSFEYVCPDLPIYEVVCDGSECSCLEDGVVVGGCTDAVEFCANVGETEPANACCGWDL